MLATGPGSAINRGAISSSIRAMYSGLVNRITFFTGKLLLEDREIDRVFRRKQNINVLDLKKRCRKGIARRIVSYFPEETWSGGFFVIETDDPKRVTRFESAVQDLVDELDLVDIFTRLDKAANYGRYSCLLLGVGQNGQEVNLPTPIIPSIDNQLIYVRVFDEEQATIKSLVRDKTSPRWGLPEYYSIKTVNPDSPESDNPIPITVHWSRIIHFCPNALVSDTYGDSDLYAVWDYLDDLDKMTGASAEIYFRQAKQLIIAEVKDNYDLGDEEETEKIIKDLEEQFLQAEEGFRTNIVTDGFNTKVLSSSINKLPGMIEPIIDLLMGTIGIPKRKFFGSEVGELASSQDRRNAQDSVQKRRQRTAEKLIRQFLARLFEFMLLLPPRSKTFKVTFSEEDDLNLMEKVQTLKIISEANKNQVDSNEGVFITSKMAMDLIGLEYEDELEDEDNSKEDDDIGSKDNGNNRKDNTKNDNEEVIP